MKNWTCPHGYGMGMKRGDCNQCNAEISRRRDPSTMTGEERDAEVMALLNDPSAYRMDAIHQRLEALVGRPVWTHEFAQDLALATEARSWDHPADLAEHAVSSMKALAGDKPVIVIDARKTP